MSCHLSLYHSTEKHYTVWASYVNIGPLFPTRTKNWTDAYLGIEGLKTISGAVDIPFTVMGGINAINIDEVVSAGARKAAVVTAITQADDMEGAVRYLRKKITG